MELRAEIARFMAAKQESELAGRQLAAVQIACHVDLSEALGTGPAERAHLILRLERLLERERLRGARRHWSYDLNRHIALKQALDRLRPADAPRQARPARHSRRSTAQTAAAPGGAA